MTLPTNKQLVIILLAICLPFLPLLVFSAIACEVKGFWSIFAIVLTLFIILACYAWLMWQQLFKAKLSTRVKLFLFIFYTGYCYLLGFFSMFVGAVSAMNACH